MLDEHLLEPPPLGQSTKGRAGAAREGPEELWGKERLAGVRHRLRRGIKPSMSGEGAVDGKAFEG